jgi:hypothetical protein
LRKPEKGDLNGKKAKREEFFALSLVVNAKKTCQHAIIKK